PAAPTLFDAFARMNRSIVPLPFAPKGALMASSAKLPPPLQHFRPGALPSESTEARLRIMFPPNGARLELTGGAGAKPDAMALKISGGVAPLTVLVNGVPLGDNRGRTLFWEPDGPGFVRLTVMDARGSADSVMVRLQ